MGLKGPIWDETFVTLILEAVFQYASSTVAWIVRRLRGQGTAGLDTTLGVSLKGKAILKAVNQTQLPLVLDNSMELFKQLVKATRVPEVQIDAKIMFCQFSKSTQSESQSV